MAYVRSLREIPLDQEPHASVLAALLPDSDEESPEEEPQVDWMSATAPQIAHLRICPPCVAVLGGSVGKMCIPSLCDVSTPKARNSS